MMVAVSVFLESKVVRALWFYRPVIIFLLTPLLLSPLIIGNADSVSRCGYVVLLMAVYWCTECLPLSVTSFIPVILFPTLGIMTSKEVVVNYLNETGMLIAGALIVAHSFEATHVHRRVALKILMLMGNRPKWLMMGFMFPTCILSMFINNLTTVAMMMPILDQLLIEWEEGQRASEQATLSFQTSDDCALNATVNPAYQMDDEIKTSRQQSDMVEDSKGLKIESNLKNNKRDVLETVFTAPVLSKDEAKVMTTILRNREQFKNYAKALNLAVCYAANAGGVGTIAGTATTLIIKAYMDDLWESHGLEPPVTYTSYMVWALPQTIINMATNWMFLLVYFMGWRIAFGLQTDEAEGFISKESTGQILRREYSKLGKIRFPEVMSGFYFLCLVLLWISRDPGFVSGWKQAFNNNVGLSAPSMFVALLLFITPATFPYFWGKQNKDIPKEMPRLLDFKQTRGKFQWDLLFLFGGGFSMAAASQKSGLSSWIAEEMSFLRDLSPFAAILVFSLLVAILTQIMSNNACASLLSPICAAVASSMQKSPLFLLLPLCCTVQFAYILPVANPPNAVVYSYGRFTMMDMIKTGALVSFLCLLPVLLATFTWGMAFYDLDTPPWNYTTSA